mgnify:FL=1
MILLCNLDIIVIVLFFLLVLVVGFIPKYTKDKDDYLLSGRKVGLLLFILTNVSTWYGGILGIGEFTYNYGLLSWFTQGLPYYIFAIVFAITMAPKISKSSLTTIPEKINEQYGKKTSLLSSIIVFILVSPAPYLLMLANIITLILGIKLIYALILSAIISSVYLFKGGYKSDLYTDAFEFFVMFIGFGLLFGYAYLKNGDLGYLIKSLPPEHLNPFSKVSIGYIIVWFLIALWTFADPGFHQRCNAAKNGNVAKYGIIISVLFWFLFDFLTNVSGLYSKLALPNLQNPVMAFPLLAENVLPNGVKGIFYAALFATVLSTLNSFLFLSATTFGNDIIPKLIKIEQNNIAKYTRYGLVLSLLISIILANNINSVIDLWYYIGSICIPPLIIVIISSYYIKYKVNYKYVVIEIIASLSGGIIWFILRKSGVSWGMISLIEPMIVGLLFAIIIHVYALVSKKTP